MQLNGIAWVLVDPERPKPSADAAKFSLEVAQKADELAKQMDPAIADTLGRAYFVNGNVTKALDTQERAVKLSKGTQFEQDKTITDRLEQYRKAAAEKK
jgi:hypothetical protein